MQLLGIKFLGSETATFRPVSLTFPLSGFKYLTWTRLETSRLTLSRMSERIANFSNDAKIEGWCTDDERYHTRCGKAGIGQN